MDTYDVWKQENEWRIVREGDTRALRVFSTKREAVTFARDFLSMHGGHLRIWKGEGDASSLQEERIYEALHAAAEPEMVRRGAQGMFDGMMKGAMDASEAAWQLVPQLGRYFSRGAYQAGYYTAYGVVYGAVMVRNLIPLPNPLANGMHDGADAALHAVGETHQGTPTATVG
jgi:hypothetical protein